MIDTHAHLYAEEFGNDREEMLARAQNAGVGKIILPGIDKGSIGPLKNLLDKHPTLFFGAAGLHPTSVKEDYLEELAAVETELKTRRYIAVGEIGIDLYWDKSYLKEQQHALEVQLRWALDADLPVIVHVRDSFIETLEVFSKFSGKGLRGVFHSFTGSIEDANNIFALGEFYLGINGIVTFKNSGLGEVVSGLPLERLLLETDAPYLTPSPYRGKRNESALLDLVAQKIAEVQNVEKSLVVKKTTENAIKLFRL